MLVHRFVTKDSDWRDAKKAPTEGGVEAIAQEGL
jgi:hypothetical protein